MRIFDSLIEEAILKELWEVVYLLDRDKGITGFEEAYKNKDTVRMRAEARGFLRLRFAYYLNLGYQYSNGR